MANRAWLPLILFLTSSWSSSTAQNASALDRDYWRRLAMKSQYYLTRQNSVATNLYCGTYQSANSLHYSSLRTEATFGAASYDDTTTTTRHVCPSSNDGLTKCFTATGKFRLFDQTLSLEEQLDFGVRRFHLTLARVSLLTPELRVCKPVPDVCRTLKRELNMLGLYEYSSTVDICFEFLGIKDYGEFSGCTEDSPSWSEILKIFSDFTRRSGNSREIIIIDVDTSPMQRFGCSQQALVEDPIEKILGDLIYTPADLNDFIRSSPTPDPLFYDPLSSPIQWPSATKVFSKNRQIIMMAPCKYSGKWFHQSTDFRKFDELTSTKEFVPQRCGTRRGSGGSVSALSRQFTGIYEDRTTFEIEIQADDGTTQGYAYLADGLDSAGMMDKQAAESVISCGYSPVFSRMRDNRVFECVWFWGEGESSLCEKGTCTAFKRIQDPASIRKYEFVNVDCERELPMACRHDHITTLWEFGRSVVFPNETGPDLDNRATSYCLDFHFPDIPTSPDDASTLLKSMTDRNVDLVWVKYVNLVTCHRDSSLNPSDRYYDVSGDCLLLSTVSAFALVLMTLLHFIC